MSDDFARFTNAKSAPDLERIEIMAGPRTRDLLDVICHLDADEMRVLVEIAKRLRMGQVQYGALDIAGDQRNWMEETHQELLDAVVYMTIRTLTRGPIEEGIDADANTTRNSRNVLSSLARAKPRWFPRAGVRAKLSNLARKAARTVQALVMEEGRDDNG